MSGEVSVEATGETVGEAKWAAVRELEALVPGLDRDTVRLQVVTEGERGLLGVGYTPARVVATAPDVESKDEPGARPDGDDAAVVQELLDRTIAALELSARARLEEQDGELVATVAGPDVSVLIGRHGQTLDALQQLANAVARRSAETSRRVVVDGGGYRRRRGDALTEIARQGAARAADVGRAVALEPMSSSERRVVHEVLKDDPEVTTGSEGAEPNRYVVIVPRLTAD
jgi:spoIIIJ-associated protein